MVCPSSATDGMAPIGGFFSNGVRQRTTYSTSLTECAQTCWNIKSNVWAPLRNVSQKKWRCGMLVETYDLDRRSDGALKEKDDWIREHQIIQKETKFKWYQNHSTKIISKSSQNHQNHHISIPNMDDDWTKPQPLCCVSSLSSRRLVDLRIRLEKLRFFLDVISMSV